MNRARLLQRALLLIVAIATACLLGCKNFEIEVVVQPDGTGTREVLVSTEIPQTEAGSAPVDQFRKLFDLQESRGWKTEALKSKGDAAVAKLAFRRREEVQTQELWNRLSGDVSIRGSLEEAYAGVRFRNSIALETGGSAAERTLTYREQFRWSELEEVLVELFAEHFCVRMQAAYPDLGHEDLVLIRGLAIGHLAMGLPRIADWAESDEDFRRLATSLADHVHKVVELRHADVDAQDVQRVAVDAVTVADDELEERLEQILPGVHEAFWTDIELRVTMPGTILESNADRWVGNTAIWKFDVMEAISAPREVFVRAQLSTGG